MNHQFLKTRTFAGLDQPHIRMKKNKLKIVLNRVNAKVRDGCNSFTMIKDMSDSHSHNSLQYQKKLKSEKHEIKSLLLTLQIEENLYQESMEEFENMNTNLQKTKNEYIKTRNKCSSLELQLQKRDFKNFVLNKKKTSAYKQGRNIPLEKRIPSKKFSNGITQLFKSSFNKKINNLSMTTKIRSENSFNAL